MIKKVYESLGLSFTAKFSTRPVERLGADELWDRAEAGLRNALEEMKLPYELKEGDGAFYGPKIDFDVSDSIGRKWQLGTIQLDYLAPERFDLGYIGEDNKEHRPVIIHRAVYGSFERFIGILIEHFAGNFPVWIAPVQARLITVSERSEAWAHEAFEKLQALGLRVELDVSSDQLGAKIRNAQLSKVPYTLVLGDKEAEGKGVAVRTHGEGKAADLGFMTLDAFIEKLSAEAKAPF
jgi:threonyl-tRNA synthetase